MNQILIIVILILPIITVIAILHFAQKKQKEKELRRHTVYLNRIAEKTGIINSFQKQLVHQLLIMDEVNKKLLIIHHKDHTYTHCHFNLEEIEQINLMSIKQAIIPEKNAHKTETYISQIGLEIISSKPDQKKFIVFYDHAVHNVYLMSELEREAIRIKDRVMQLKALIPMVS